MISKREYENCEDKKEILMKIQKEQREKLEKDQRAQKEILEKDQMGKLKE